MNGAISVKETAQRLNIHPKTVRVWVDNGTLKGKKIDVNGRNRYIIDERSINDLIRTDEEYAVSAIESVANSAENQLTAITKKIDDYTSQTRKLEQTIVMEQNHRSRETDKLVKSQENLLNNQSKLYTRMDQILNQFEYLSKQIEDFTIMKQTHQPSSISASMRTPTQAPTPKQSWAEPNIKNVGR